MKQHKDEEKPENKDIEDLRWVRIFTPDHIPKYLVEQIKHRDFTIEKFYKYHEKSCIKMTPEGPTLNPLSHLYVLVDDDNITKGFLWFTVDPLNNNLNINSYSIDKEYWGRGKAVSKLAEFIKDIRRKGKLNKVFWITNYPKHSLKNGFKQSSSVLMEYSEEENG